MREFCFLVVLMGIAAASVMATADEGCVPCEGSEPEFPNEAAYLEVQGYPPEEYTILLTWTETSRRAPRMTVRGYRVRPLAGAEPFDLYSGPDGYLLDAQELEGAGIEPKNWDVAPIDTYPEVASPPHKASVPKPAPLVPKLGSFLPAASIGYVELPPIDFATVWAEDEAGGLANNKGVKRIGVFQELAEPVRVAGSDATHGEWQWIGFTSRIWATTLRSPGAVAQRIHFQDFQLPAGSRVVIYDTNNPEEAYGPLTHTHPEETDLWSPSCFAEEVTVECYVPGDADLGAVRLTIDRTVHIYTGFADLQWAKAAGSCNLDVSCYPDWDTPSLGVGGIGTIGNTGYLWCTGTLVVDADPATDVPYFLTANHCVGSQTKASTMEVYWLYQSDSCGGAVPSPSTVPRTTGGADYLAGVSNTGGTDFTLLRLRNAPPEGITYVGWSSAPVAVGSEVTCIHHPRGDFKRISFGTTQAAEGDDLKPLTHYVKVQWHDGTTEPGSSGSPLLLDTHQIVGQLYGGLASCSLPEEPDFYGRFDISYPLIQSWLGLLDSPADVDGSGVVDAADIQIVVNAALNKTVGYDADVDDSGAVDAVDVQLVIIAALGFPAS